jgi:dynein heavy chain 2
MAQDVEDLISRRPMSFHEESIMRVSKAAGPLALWVKANVKYSYVLHKIKPLETELNETNKALDYMELALKD